MRKKYKRILAGVLLGAVVACSNPISDYKVRAAGVLNDEELDTHEDDGVPGILEDDDFESWREFEKYLKKEHQADGYTYKIVYTSERTETGGKSFDHKYIIIKKYTGSKEAVSIPKKLSGLPVKIIGKAAFRNNKNLKTVKISDIITKVEKGAFSGCKAKIVKPSYLKKQKGGSYEARAFVKVPGRKKKVSYKASKVTKIKGTRNVTVRKNKKKKIYTSVYYAGKRKTGFLDYSILKFTSSNKKVVTVSKYGNIKGIKKGTATITVKLRTTGKGYRMKVKVR